METNHKTIHLILEIHLELNNDQIHISTQLRDLQPPSLPPAPVLPPESEAEEDFLFEGPNAITVDEAVGMLKGCRGTVTNLRNKDKLTSYYKGRNVRLDRRQVLEAMKWWSVPKGKI